MDMKTMSSFFMKEDGKIEKIMCAMKARYDRTVPHFSP